VHSRWCRSLLLASLLRNEAALSTPAEFPVHFREGLIWVEVKVPQSAEPLNFLLDTGASASVINLVAARRLGLELGPPVSVKGVNATVTGHWPVKMSAAVSSIELPRKYLGLDLKKLSGACGLAVDGLIGADFFSDRVVQIDYAAQKVRLLDAGPGVQSNGAIPLEVRPCGLRVLVGVNGHKRQWVRLDTGCATPLQWVTAHVPASKCLCAPAVGLSELSIPQTLTSVTFGGQRIENVATGLHPQAIFPGEAGLLGNGLLACFGSVTIDARSGHLLLGSRP
jgi:hypothetical protein